MYEYKVIFAPRAKKRSVLFWKKDRSASNLSDLINNLASDNWEFKSSERGLGKSDDMLIFQREIPALEETTQKEVARAIAVETFDRRVIPRRPRPMPHAVVDLPEFQARREAEQRTTAATQLGAVMAATR